MSILSNFRALFTRKPGLRNKPHQMAWVVGMPGSDAQLNGRAVKTVSFADGIWRIDPPQHVIYRTWTQGLDGTVNPPGRHQVIGLLDANLEPWKEDGVTDEEVTQLYAPQVKEHA
jgi:hypothetical protein